MILSLNRANLFALFLLFTTLLPAQEVITIEECQQLAIAQSSANVQKELNTQLLRVKLNDVSSHYYPTLEINGAVAYVSEMPQLPTECLGFQKMDNDLYNVTLSFRQVVFDGLRATYGRKRERLLNKNEISKLDISINQIKEQVISIYLNLLIIEKQITILSSVENTFDEQSDQLKALLKAGVVYGNTIAQFELEGLKIQQQKDELQAMKKSLKSSLSILTGRDMSNLSFTMPELPVIENNTNSSRYEFSIFKNQMESLDYQRKLHVSNSLPQIAFFATGGYGYPTYNLLNNNFDWFYSVGFQFKVPLIDWVKTKGVSDIIKLQSSILKSQESDFEKANQIAIQEKLNEINKIENLLVLDKQITQKYQEIKQTASTQLLNGTITALDFIKQQNDEVQSIIAQEMHTIQLLKAKYELLALKGKL